MKWGYRYVCIVALAAASAGARAESDDTWALGGNVSLVSDYLFRGISQTQRRPVLQGGLDYTHNSGFYASIWGSGVANAAYNNTAGMEIDLIGGYRAAIGSIGLDLALSTYNYPRAHVNGTDVRYHTQEAKVGLNYGVFNVTGWVGLNKYWFGFFGTDGGDRRIDTRGSTYLEANWSPPLNDNGWTANFHAGKQWIHNLGAYNFEDFKIGVSKDLTRNGLPGWSASAGVVHNTGDRQLWIFSDPDGSTKRVVGTTALLTIGKVF